jgi:hypothetical protein
MLEIAMVHTKQNPNRPVARDGALNTAKGRRSYSAHAKLVNNAFLVVFAQYERAFEELAKV